MWQFPFYEARLGQMCIMNIPEPRTSVCPAEASSTSRLTSWCHPSRATVTSAKDTGFSSLNEQITWPSTPSLCITDKTQRWRLSTLGTAKQAVQQGSACSCGHTDTNIKTQACGCPIPGGGQGQFGQGFVPWAMIQSFPGLPSANEGKDSLLRINKVWEDQRCPLKQH